MDSDPKTIADAVGAALKAYVRPLEGRLTTIERRELQAVADAVKTKALDGTLPLPAPHGWRAWIRRDSNGLATYVDIVPIDLPPSSPP